MRPARRWLLAGILGILLAVGLVYIPAYHAGFIWDDDDYLTINPLIVKSGGFTKIWDPGSGMNQQYYPMLYTSFLAEKALWGVENPRGFHVTNVVLHAANSILLLLLLLEIEVPGAFLVAALFALHPVHVESVSWISERKNVLSGFFYLLAALSFLRFDRTPRFRDLALSLALFLLSLFSKTVTASLPVALALVYWYRRQPLTRSRVRALGAMLAVGLLFGLMTRSYEYRHVASAASDATWWTPAERLLVAGRAFWFYPWKIVWPAHLSFSYDPWRISTAVAWQWLFPLAAAAAAGVTYLLYRRRSIGRGPVAAALFYAATIFPALGFVRVAYMRYTPVADHFTYLATVGVLLLAVAAGRLLLGLGARKADGAPRAWLGRAAASAVLVSCAALSFQHARIFHDLHTLWADTCRTSPSSWLGQLNYGVQLKREGDYAGAADHFQRVAQLDPPPSEAAFLASANLSSIYFRQGHYEQALATAEDCLKYKADYPLALFNQGRSLEMLGRMPEAERVLSSLVALKFDPDEERVDWDVRRRLDDASVYVSLADVQAAQGKFAAAKESYRMAVEHAPSSQSVHEARVKALSQWGSTSDLIGALREAAKSSTKPTLFRLQLAWVLAVAASPGDRNGQEALTLSEALVKELGDRNASALSILAAAQAETGEFDRAAQTAGHAVELAQAAGQAELVRQATAQRDAYARRNHVYSLPSAAAASRAAGDSAGIGR